MLLQCTACSCEHAVRGAREGAGQEGRVGAGTGRGADSAQGRPSQGRRRRTAFRVNVC